MTSRIRAARDARGWSQTRLIAELEQIAGRQGVELPSRETLKSRVSRWENQHSRPDDFYRQLLREALGMDDVELGFARAAEDSELSAAEELRNHLSVRTTADSDLVAALSQQTSAIRRQDRQFGAGPLLEQMRAHLHNIEQHLAYAVLDPARRPLAALLADGASLAGWQALDVLAHDQAWRFFETSSRAALQAEDWALFAFARMEQAHVVRELTDGARASDLASSVWSKAGDRVFPALQCWLAAATAEMLASAGQHREARAMLHHAEHLSSALRGQEVPYLVFDTVHLERWIGHVLVVLNDRAGEEHLRSAEKAMDSTFTRAAASLHIDLARAMFARDEREGAKAALGEGERLARAIGSRRQLNRVRELRGCA